MSTEILRQFVENERLRAHLKSELEAANAEKARLEPMIVQIFSEEGVQSQKLKMADGSMPTVHLRRELWAGHQGNAQALCDALKDGGYASQVKENFNTQSLSSLVRELATEFHQTEIGKLSVEQIMEAVPENIRACLKVSEMFKIGMRS